MSLQELQPNAAWDQIARNAINTAIRKIKDASTTVAGLLETATDAEAIAKSATDKALVPSNLAAIGASATFAGLIEIATDAEALAVTATDKALVPSNFSGKAGQQAYTEGTFTPALSFGGGTTGITYSVQTGAYTRIGRIVHFEIQITLSSKGTSTGSAAISGLPLTVANIGPAALQLSGVGATVGDKYIGAVLASGGTSVSLQQLSAGGVVALLDTDFGNGSVIRVQGVYRTSA